MFDRKIAAMSACDGVGKTISVINLGYELANCNWRVLLVDMDPKGTMTRILGINHHIGIAELIASRMNDTSLYNSGDYIVHHSENLDFIAGANKLSVLELFLAASTNESLVHETLNSLPDNYDFVIIDCKSGLGQLNCNILGAIDSLILPTLATTESVHDLQNFITVVKRLCKLKRIGSRVDLDGIIINRLSNNYDLESIEHITHTIKRITQDKIDMFDAFSPLTGADEFKDVHHESHAGRKVIAEAYRDLATKIDSKAY